MRRTQIWLAQKITKKKDSFNTKRRKMKDTTAQQDDETSLSSAKYQNETDSDGNGEYENPKKKMRSAGEKKRDRILANRRSAKESRERRKKLIQGLEESVSSLTSENAVLSRENENLRWQLETMMIVNAQHAANASTGTGVASNPLLANPLASALLRQQQTSQNQYQANGATNPLLAMRGGAGAAGLLGGGSSPASVAAPNANDILTALVVRSFLPAASAQGQKHA